MSAVATSSARMNRALQHERDQKMRLQEVVEQLARQHDNLEKTVTARSTPHTGEYKLEPVGDGRTSVGSKLPQGCR